jgi:hypothetical protein
MNLYSFHGNVMTKSVVTRMSFRLDKDVETYLLKSRSDDNEKMSFYRQISYFFTLIIYSINLLKTARKTFAIGNAKDDYSNYKR